jgi:hypothetical protein
MRGAGEVSYGTASAEDTVDNGTRIRVVKGRKHKDKVGTIFWSGDDKYREGKKRFGVHADNGETLWIPDEYALELTEGDEGFVAETGDDDELDKGDLIEWTDGEEQRIGKVFWLGEARTGVGLRLGVRIDGEEEARWVNSRRVKLLAHAPEPAGTAVADDDIPF